MLHRNVTSVKKKKTTPSSDLFQVKTCPRQPQFLESGHFRPVLLKIHEQEHYAAELFSTPVSPLSPLSLSTLCHHCHSHNWHSHHTVTIVTLTTLSPLSLSPFCHQCHSHLCHSHHCHSHHSVTNVTLTSVTLSPLSLSLVSLTTVTLTILLPMSLSPLSPSPLSLSPLSPSPLSLSPLSPSPLSLSSLSPSPLSLTSFHHAHWRKQTPALVQAQRGLPPVISSSSCRQSCGTDDGASLGSSSPPGVFLLLVAVPTVCWRLPPPIVPLPPQRAETKNTVLLLLRERLNTPGSIFTIHSDDYPQCSQMHDMISWLHMKEYRHYTHAREYFHSTHKEVSVYIWWSVFTIEYLHYYMYLKAYPHYDCIHHITFHWVNKLVYTFLLASQNFKCLRCSFSSSMANKDPQQCSSMFSRFKIKIRMIFFKLH